MFAQAQYTNQTVRKTISGGALTLTPSGDSLYTRAQTRALIPTVPAGLSDSLAKKANRTFDNVASGAIAQAKVANLVSDLALKAPLASPTFTGTVTAPTFAGALSGNASTASLSANSTLWSNQQYNSTTLTTSPTVILAFDGSMYRPTSATGIQTFLGITGGPFLPVANPTFTGALSGPTITATGRVIAGGGDGNGFRVPSNESSGFSPTDGLSLTTAFNVGYLANKNNGNFRPMYYDALSHNFNTIAGSGDVLVSGNNDGKIDKVTVGSGLSLSAGVLTATGGSSGTVTTAGGTAGRIVKFTSASNVENSVMTESSGNISMSGTMTAGTFSGAATNLTGTASSLSIGGNAATATNSTQWGGNTINKGTAYGSGITYLSGFDYTAGSSEQRIFTAAAVQGFLGLGSNAYTSTAFAPLASPTFTGTPTAPTQTAADNSTKIATTAYVDAAVGGVSGTYTPTFTNNTNITSSSIVGSATYSLTGNIMHVSMAVSIDPVAASTTTVLYFTRPSGYDTASTVSNGNVTSNGFGYGAAQYQSSALGKMTFTPTTADTQVFFLQFDYEYAN